MTDVRKQGLLQGMGEWSVANIVKEDSDLRCLPFIFCHLNSLAAQNLECLLHEVHGTEGMVKPGVDGSRVDQLSEAKLSDVSHSLKKWMLDQIENQFTFDRDKPVYRVVNDLILVHRVS